MGLVLDSSVAIAAERRGDNVTQLLKQIFSTAGNQPAVLSSVGLTELVHGIYRAQTPQARARRESFIHELLDDLEVYPYTRGEALLAGKIDGEQQERGVTIPLSDLLTGATALTHGYSVFTVNVRHFRLIPGLKIVSF
ncbi:MAG: PIN domain-containing protein [Candidatus Korobacteraceae bacterium]